MINKTIKINTSSELLQNQRGEETVKKSKTPIYMNTHFRGLVLVKGTG
jgi:hypothetical protein